MIAYHSYSDQELTALLRSGDRAAFSEVYQRYWPLLYRHARKLLHIDEAAKDIVQDVFISLWTAATEFDAQTALSPYLYASTRNKILNWYRHNKIANVHLESLGDFMTAGSNVTDHLAGERMLAKQIEKEIENLPPRMREVFELKRKQNLSYKQIAIAMNISELTVKTQMNKAIRILRGKFGNSMNVFFPFL
ncbi:RNA polymerase sigma-70 factor (ECF subfamily) [Arcticibacter tournemirensis]|uniref:RNA polymerase sigma factor n=1 Tax=Arcticibacter tournemirensis TaxID=699437 RepID=UPI0011544E36|nr:RNA polymerase sigma-70 factor [Arcticibacter tournemirensis]TQM51628.1 RNA polymerase sigma-70 factor (ECF subfamily) [Arcticibacter tournemirensis]